MVRLPTEAEGEFKALQAEKPGRSDRLAPTDARLGVEPGGRNRCRSASRAVTDISVSPPRFRHVWNWMVAGIHSFSTGR